MSSALSETGANPPPGSIALALGAGGARGLAHIGVLEAFDELGVRPVAIAGTSMGAIVGAAYAAGLSARDIRAHALSLMRKRSEAMARLLKARIGRFARMFSDGLGNPMLIDGEMFLDLFWPEAVPDRFEELTLPFIAVATDFVSRREAALASGPLAPAVAGSMAIPGLVKPVEIGPMILIDGGATNPLPYDHLLDIADIVVACDVMTGGGDAGYAARSPRPFAAVLGAAQIMQVAITQQKLKTRAPDLLIRPAVEAFRALDFFKLGQILQVAEAAKDELKRDIERILRRRS
ncbi:MAG: patatin-like phospholipase family protein [Methylobacteriaceae bacterium]|nr:patatin-like phospholipase family protein [Methylobacteriaceae bacterium]